MRASGASAGVNVSDPSLREAVLPSASRPRATRAALRAGGSGIAFPVRSSGIGAEIGRTLDGRVDEMWGEAGTIKVTVSEGANLPGGSTELTLKALYSEDTLYLLVTGPGR